MAVDFYDINDKAFKNILFSIEHRDFDEFRGVLIEFKKLTGLTIDQYGDARIDRDHVKLIVQLIEKKSNKNLLKIKEKFSNTNCDLMALGD